MSARAPLRAEAPPGRMASLTGTRNEVVGSVLRQRSIEPPSVALEVLL